MAEEVKDNVMSRSNLGQSSVGNIVVNLPQSDASILRSFNELFEKYNELLKLYRQLYDEHKHLVEEHNTLQVKFIQHCSETGDEKTEESHICPVCNKAFSVPKGLNVNTIICPYCNTTVALTEKGETLEEMRTRVKDRLGIN